MKKKLLTVNLLLVSLLLIIKINGISSNTCGTRAEREYDEFDELAMRLTNGLEVHRNEWPFLAALHYTDYGTFFCGGTLITAQNVLTGMIHPRHYITGCDRKKEILVKIYAIAIYKSKIFLSELLSEVYPTGQAIVCHQKAHLS